MVKYADSDNVWTLNEQDQLNFDQLINYTVDGKLIPGLATAWTASPDATTYHFDLRKDVKWHDGQPFTAADVEFTIKTVTRKESKSPLGTAYNLTNIKGGAAWSDGSSESLPGLKVTGDYAIDVTLETPDAAFLNNISQLNIQGKHVFADVALKDVTTSPHAKQTLIGTGPFKVTNFVADQYYTVEANPDYFRGKPSIQKWSNNIYKDVNTAALALERGDISVVINPTGSTLEHLMTLPGARLAGGPVMFSNLLGFNVKAKNMTDVRVRQAFIYALDRQSMVDAFYPKRARIINSQITPDVWRNKDLDSYYPYDPAKAKQLLQAASWDSSTEVKFITYYTDQNSKDLFSAMQQAWKAVDLNVSINYQDGPTFVKSWYQDFAYDVSYAGGSGGFEPDVQRQYFMSGMAYPKGYNASQYANPTLDSLFTKGLQTTVFDERKKIYDQVQKILEDDAVWVALWEPYRFAYTNKNVCNLTYIQSYATWNPWQWYVGS
jgi:peptide/nickel transport system substrate-binding protein